MKNIQVNKQNIIRIVRDGLDFSDLSPICSIKKLNSSSIVEVELCDILDVNLSPVKHTGDCFTYKICLSIQDGILSDGMYNLSLKNSLGDLLYTQTILISGNTGINQYLMKG